jgi:hypothetical protein
VRSPGTTDRHAWLSLTPEPEAELPRAIAALRGGDQPSAGGRGGERLDIAAVAAAVARVDELLLEHGLGLLELNPVVEHPQGCVALYAVAKRR